MLEFPKNYLFKILEYWITLIFKNFEVMSVEVAEVTNSLQKLKKGAYALV